MIDSLPCIDKSLTRADTPDEAEFALPLFLGDSESLQI